MEKKSVLCYTELIYMSIKEREFMNTETVYSNGAMLQWTGHFAEMMDISPEKIKLLNVCQKKKNVIPSIESHKRVLVFADSSHKSLFYDIWEAGLGDCDVWYGTGITPSDHIQTARIRDLINTEISEPTVIFILNENTRESYKIGIKNENFSRGPIHYVGSEIRAVIMSLLHVDAQDVICIVSGESIAIEAAIVASEGTIIAVEHDEASQAAMEENVEKFGVHNIEIVPDLSPSSLSTLPTPRLAFIVATKNLELHIQNLLGLNPKMQFVIYTLELDILSGIKDIFERNKIHNMEVLQISVSKLDSKNVFVTQPSPWLITGEA